MIESCALNLVGLTKVPTNWKLNLSLDKISEICFYCDSIALKHSLEAFFVVISGSSYRVSFSSERELDSHTELTDEEALVSPDDDPQLKYPVPP